MSTVNYFFRIAFQNVLRSGQRGIVALLCIAFGVMSLVAMILVAESITGTLVLEPQRQVGADLSMGRAGDGVIVPEQVAQLATLKQQGVIDRYVVAAITSSLMFRVGDSTQAHFVPSGMGVELQNYPLVGRIVMREPAEGNFSQLLAGEDAVLVTRDVATDEHLKVGDVLLVSDLTVGVPVRLQLRGIIEDTPNHMGGKLYYTLATAKKIANGANAINTALATTSNVSAAQETLQAQGWQVYTATALVANQKQGEDLINLLLKGAGVLALLVGGIGIANTMQVLLQRRRREVAIWKTMGYTTRDLYILFTAEAALFGVVGSVIGAGLGFLVSAGLVDLFSRTTNFLFGWTFDMLPLVVGTLAGIVTTALFALWAIVMVSRVEPMSLLRNETVDAARVPWWRSAWLAVVLAIPFGVLTIWILGSPVQGIGVLLFAVVGMAVLALIFAGLDWLVTRFVPFGGIPVLRIAQNSLRRRGSSLLFAMMALFVGVVALAFGFVFTQNAQEALAARTLKVDGYNVVVLAPATQEQTIKNAMGNAKSAELAQTSVKAIHGVGDAAGNYVAYELIGATEPYNYKVWGAAWGEKEGVYIYDVAPIATGSEIEITLWDGSTRKLPVIGRYSLEQNPTSLWTSFGPLMPLEMSRKIAPPDAVRVYAQADAQKIARLSSTLHDVTVIDLAEYAARFTQQYRNLFVLAVAMAGLALAAGVLLIANAVSLAMLDRQYEIGVLKTLGYTRRDMWFTLAVEYGIVALIASAAGLAVVEVALTVLALANGVAASLLSMNWGQVGIILAVAVLLTLGTVLAVTWQPMRRSAVFILNDRA